MYILDIVIMVGARGCGQISPYPISLYPLSPYPISLYPLSLYPISLYLVYHYIQYHYIHYHYIHYRYIHYHYIHYHYIQYIILPTPYQEFPGFNPKIPGISNFPWVSISKFLAIQYLLVI